MHSGLEFKLHRDEYSELNKISADVPQGSVLEPIPYLLYTKDISTTNKGTLTTFANDIRIMAIGNNVADEMSKLQKIINAVCNNETKSTHINFTYQRVGQI